VVSFTSRPIYPHGKSLAAGVDVVVSCLITIIIIIIIIIIIRNISGRQNNITKIAYLKKHENVYSDYEDRGNL
jgi:hypothetical protein